MNRNFRILSIVSLVTALLVFALTSYGCQYTTPVKNINLGKAALSETGTPPPSGIWMSFPSGPYNDTVYSFNRGEEILIYIELESRLEAPTTFTKFTFYNKETGNEVTIELLDDLGAFEAEESHIWHTQAPNKDGEYELRIYINKRIVASALLDIG